MTFVIPAVVLQRARLMYERLGFVRYHAIDHRHDTVEVIGYRLELREGDL